MKIKISGGTQTAQPPNNYVSDSEYGHYMGSPGSNRKVYNQPPPSNSKSLPKGASSLNYGLMMEKIQQKRQQRQYSPKINDGSLSDSNYYDLGNRSSSPYSWLQPASAYAAANMGLQGNNSHESNGRPALIPEDLSVCSTVASDILGSNESLNSVSSSIQQARANSLTKARLLLHQQQISRSASTGNAQITSTRSNVSERSYSSLSTNRTNNGTTGESDYYGVPSFNLRNRNMENCYGSIGGGATEQEKTEAAIVKLRKELAEEHDKVLNLTSQLATNAHVVAAFEQSLANMTSRLAHLTATAEKKDHELNELRRKIELFKQCGVDAGLIPQDSNRSQQQFGDQSDSECDSPVAKNGKPKRSGWLRNSFSKAFNKNSSGKKASLGSVSDAEPESPKHKPSRASSALSGQIDSMIPVSPIKSSKSSDTIDGNANPSSELINELKRQLVEKENLLTETRLEALSSAHQLESLRDTVTKMRTELMSVKSENEKLHTIVQNHKSLNSSQNSLNNNENDDDRARRHSSTLSESSILSGPSSLDLSATTDPTNREGGKLVPVVVLNTDKSFTRIGTISVSGRSNWELLDSLVHRLFKEYVMRVDPTSNLGLNAESIGYYQAGEIKRTSMAARKPELLPYGYLVGDATDIVVSLKRSPDGNSNNLLVDALAFETLTPKSIIQRYVALLLESKRIVLSGPCGSGKTFIALKIANFIVNKSKKSIANFCVQRNNVPELKDFLKRLTDEDQSEDKQDMNVVILDNLHHAGRLDDVFQECQLPRNCYIIGTMVGQGAQTPTNLQLQHNFRVIQLTPHAEPLRGLVGRCLRQRLLSIEAKTRMLDGEMSAAVDWVAKIHLHLNKILEAHASGDILLSPVLFMDCPIGHEEGPEAQGDQVRRWFLHLWNDTLHPRISEAIKEGIQLYGHRVQWEDPIKYLEDTWPWANSAPLEMERILPEDVGYDLKKSSDLQCRLPRPSSTGTSLSSGSGTNTESDPLFNMLLHLQEAAAANNDTAITN